MPPAVAEGSVATEVLSCMRLYTLTGVAVENSYILSRRLRHHCAIIIVFFVAFVVIIGLFVFVSSSSLLVFNYFTALFAVTVVVVEAFLSSPSH